jgi:H+/Cl- antiporter ClcA
MTGRGDLTLALLGASLMAILVSMLLKSEPIYETLKRRMLNRQAVAGGLLAGRTRVVSGAKN